MSSYTDKNVEAVLWSVPTSVSMFVNRLLTDNVFGEIDVVRVCQELEQTISEMKGNARQC